jgi:LPXTG-motif cell wall-anchored protein
MRSLIGFLTVTTLIGSITMLMLSASPAYADPNAPGNNGTIKIHEIPEREPAMANDPHVCRFHVHGFNFDDDSEGTWWIVAWPPTGDGSSVVRGPTSWSAGASGEWISAQVNLGNGHYKAYAKQRDEPTPGGNKQKVFWVECGGAGSTGGQGGQSAGRGSTATTTTTSTTTSAAGMSQPQQAVQGVQQAPVAGAQGSAILGVESLPATGTSRDPMPLVLLGLGLISIGGVLLRRGPGGRLPTS